jgi:hypothetical protein
MRVRIRCHIEDSLDGVDLHNAQTSGHNKPITYVDEDDADAAKDNNVDIVVEGGVAMMPVTRQ